MSQGPKVLKSGQQDVNEAWVNANSSNKITTYKYPHPHQDPLAIYIYIYIYGTPLQAIISDIDKRAVLPSYTSIYI